MRRVLAALAALAALPTTACSGDRVGPPPRPPVGPLVPVSVPEAGAEIVTAKERAIPTLYAEALSAPVDGGPPFVGLEPLLNRDLSEFSSPGMPPAHEPAGIVAAHAALFGAFDDRKVTLSRVWRTPDEQSIEWVMTGIQAHPWMGVRATDKPISFRGLTLLWTKDDGTVVDIHVYLDVGLVKALLTGEGPKDLLTLPRPAPPSTAPKVFDQTQAGAATPTVGVVKAWLDDLEKSREAAYVDALTEDAQIETLESAAPMSGRDYARRYFVAAHRAIGQLDTTIDNAWGVGTFAVVEYDIDGEQLGTFSWIPLLAPLPARTTQLAHFDLVDICEIRGGKIAHVWRYDNPAEVLGATSRANELGP